MLIRRISGVLLLFLLSGLVSPAMAQQLCEIDRAQQLFGENPRPTAEVEHLLAACRAAGVADYRIAMLAGVMAREAGDTGRAIALLKQAREQDPDAVNPALELAFTLERGQPQDAGRIYEQVLAKDPTSRAASLGLERVLRAQAAPAQAQQSCEIDRAQQLFGETPRPTAEVDRLLAACRAAASKDYRVAMLAGVMAREAGDTARAIELLKEAREQAPDVANPALELAFTLERSQPQEAAGIYEQVLAKDSGSQAARLGLARVQPGPAATGTAPSSCDIDKAQQLFGQTPRPTAEVGRLLAACRAAGSKDYRVAMLAGVMAREAGDTARAIELLKEAREQAPDGINPALELAFTLERGQPQEAARIYEQLLTRDPASRAASLGLERVLRAQAASKAEQSCEIDKAQQLFGETPRPTAAIERLLVTCRASGSKDYRVALFAGVMARDAGDTVRAVSLLKEAREQAPGEANPALELAFTLEPSQPKEAAGIYEQLLAKDPGSRSASLGLARVLRGQFEFDRARAIYEGLLKADPRDTEAMNGLAWIEVAEKNREKARSGFERVLEIQPQDAEAKVGLTKVDDVYRTSFDAYGVMVSTSMGSSWGIGGTGLFGITAFDTLEIGEVHYTNELQTLTFAGVAVLPSDDVRIGYGHAVPFRYNFGVAYDYRAHSAPLPDEHWIEGTAGYYFTDYFRWFGSYRQMMGAPQWNGRLIRAGFGALVSPSWEVTGSVFNAAQQIFNNYTNIWSWVVDIAYQGPSNTIVVFGVGYSPLINNFDLHARAVLPITDRVGFQLSVAHNSINADTRALAGIRVTW